ncbi:GntR family transcriptional regulator [Halolactibacillus alkaliphilus]|uniref:GntR family transcriptional regulator n=1 Tax=Halolactibacillus alkaliphilus TaxID=442899 RepID=A0A511WYG2_9BACI|nr:GntR family transcriptional regulator [Halolactibacillus alkaliphilus]GEN55543.1 GntR family transcriptional regulator [Halolactibacillus alkaliphilus]GGN64137.1 GntR family transcriptional regulator [Halolactibacillus alkaliphilus]SFO61806.1 DNA-binding transcriptional regulator, GntR family [Halolactibacillus alkaliphilus]
MAAKYEIIEQDIKQKIVEGVFLPGDKIYSEADLRSKYEVSNTTVVKALNNLVSEGYLIRIQGKGTYVRRNMVKRKVLFSESFPSEKIKDKKIIENTETIIKYPLTNDALAKKLGDLTGKEPLIHITQIAYINGTPWKIQNRYLLNKYVTDEGIENIRQGGSVTKQLLQDTSDLHADISINVTNIEKDDEKLVLIQDYIKEHYKDIFKIAYFDIEKLTKNAENQIVEYTRSFIDPEYYHIDITT